jgi:hypothetical protein
MLVFVSHGRASERRFIAPAFYAAKLPSGAGRMHEIKHDGYRTPGRCHRAAYALRFDWTDRIPAFTLGEAATKRKNDSEGFSNHRESAIVEADGGTIHVLKDNDRF